MLRLTKILNLREDVLHRSSSSSNSDSPSYSSSPTNSSLPHFGSLEEPTTNKAFLRHKRVLVGKERDGTLLISRFIYERDIPKTCIDLYDFKLRELKTIYVHAQQINVIGCTVNEDKSILGFTVRADGSSDSDPLFLYSSYVVELSPSFLLPAAYPPGQPIPIEVNSPRPHRLQFLNGLGGEKTTTHLLLCGQDECSLHHIGLKLVYPPTQTLSHLPTAYQINRDNSSSQFQTLQTSITKPIKKHPLSKRTVWYEFDPVRLHLYLLCKTATNKGTPEQNDQHIFKFFNFHISKSAPFYELPLSIILPHSNKLDLLYPFPYTFGSVQRVAPHLHVVRMAGNAICLCQQHEIDSLCIKVSIFALHLRQKLDFWIPLNNTEGGWSVVSRTRVLFECIEDMLLVYIPGYFLQLVDCGEEHYPCISITINDREFSSPLPEEFLSKSTSTNVQASTVVPFPLKSEDRDGRLTMLDTLTGVVYEYTFDRGSLLHIFDTDNTRLHVQTLHLACIHMHDSELVNQIILHMCSQNPQGFTVELMKEFLIGAPYQDMKALLMDPLILQLLPVTSAELLDNTQMKKIPLYNATISNFYGYSSVPGTKNVIISKEEEWRKRKYPQEKTGGGKSGGERVTSSSKESVSVSQFLKSMFSIGSPEEPPIRRANPNGGVEESDPDDVVEECCALPFSNFVEALTDYWVSQLPNNGRLRLLQWATNYRDAQIAQVNRLYRHIYKSTLLSSGGIYPHNNGSLFQLLERLYIAVEELALPFPKNFHSTFASLGFKCLPRGAFLQFVDRGIISLTPTFIRELLLMPNMEDWDFRLQLLLRLRDSNRAFELYQTVDSSPHQILLESAISSLPLGLPSETEADLAYTSLFVDMELYNNSPFIPLSALHGYLNNKVSHLPSSPSFSSPTSPPPSSPNSVFSPSSPSFQPSPETSLSFINRSFSKMLTFSDSSYSTTTATTTTTNDSNDNDKDNNNDN